MDIILKELTKDRAVFELPKQNETLLHLLTERLESDERVESASYFIGHPELDNPVIKIKTKSITPKVIIKNVADDIANDFATLKKLLDDQ